MSSAFATASGEPGVRQLSISERSNGSGTSTSAFVTQRSYGTSMCTGPGRPLRASLNALGRNLPRSATECAWKLRFVITLAIAREVGLDSAGTPPAGRPSRTGVVATWPVIAMNADES